MACFFGSTELTVNLRSKNNYLQVFNIYTLGVNTSGNYFYYTKYTVLRKFTVVQHILHVVMTMNPYIYRSVALILVHVRVRDMAPAVDLASPFAPCIHHTLSPSPYLLCLFFTGTRAL